MGTATIGPWPGSTITPPSPSPTPGHPLRTVKGRHVCPERCHVCPDLPNPDGGYDVMPFCWNGANYNDLDGCFCMVPD